MMAEAHAWYIVNAQINVIIIASFNLCNHMKHRRLCFLFSDEETGSAELTK